MFSVRCSSIVEQPVLLQWVVGSIRYGGHGINGDFVCFFFVTLQVYYWPLKTKHKVIIIDT